MQEKKSDELDLQRLFDSTLLIIKINLKKLVGFGLAGALTLLLINMLSKRVYESKMLVSSSMLSLTYVNEIVKNLNVLNANKDHDLVAAKLGLSVDEVKSLSAIEVESAVNDKLEQLKEVEKVFLRIRAGSSNRDIFPKLQNGLIKYLESNDYVKVRVEQRRKYYENLIARVDKELKDLEELKAKMISGEFFGNVNGNLMFDPTVINSKIIDLTKQRIDYENSLALASNIQVIEGFTANEERKLFSKPVAIIAGGILGLLLGALFIAVKYTIKKMNSLDAKTNAFT